MDHHRDDAMVRVQIYAALAGDARYNQVIRDIKMHPKWDRMEVRNALHAAAKDVNDFLSPITTVAVSKEKRKIVNLTKKQAAKARRAKPIDSDSEEMEPENLTKIVLAAVTAALSKRAHPTSTRQSKKPAEGPKLTPAELADLKLETCLNFQNGTCRYGDSCHRLHITLSDADAEGLKEEVVKRMTFADAGVCYNFRSNGTCSFGSKCKFAHDDTEVKTCCTIAVTTTEADNDEPPPLEYSTEE